MSWAEDERPIGGTRPVSGARPAGAARDERQAEVEQRDAQLAGDERPIGGARPAETARLAEDRQPTDAGQSDMRAKRGARLAESARPASDARSAERARPAKDARLSDDVRRAEAGRRDVRPTQPADDTRPAGGAQPTGGARRGDALRGPHASLVDDTAPEPLVTFSHVGFSYGGGDARPAAAPALADVSFSVAAGRATALVGPNGSGKSTALRLLLGLDHPTSGEVRFDGAPITAEALRDRAFAKRLRQRVGLVFQDPDVQLFCPSVTDEIAFGPRQMGLADDEVARRTADCLALFGLEGLADRAPWRLSGGERRRCAIACVVSLAPELLCLDEPTNGLDERSYVQVVAFLRAYVARGATVLVATHDERLVRDLDAIEVRLG